jgi:hypothetical protein
MKVIAPDHPILKGIPLDSMGRVKIFRDRYPAEESHTPVGGKRNYEYRWCTHLVADKAAGTTVLGVLDGTEDRACFAVVEKGGQLANGASAGARFVQLFMNENGSGGSRRVFLALTDFGRVLFIRAARWAMGEELQPYQSFRILDVTQAGPQRLNLGWQGTPEKNYRILGSIDGSNWSTVVDDIRAGAEGTVKRTLDISQGPQALFLRVAPVPW